LDVISERTKVEKYLSGFQVPGLEHARSIVNQNKELHEDFNAVMDYLGDEVRSKQALFTKADAGGCRSVSAFTTKTNLGGNNGKGGRKWLNAKKDGKKDEKTPVKAGKSKGKKDKAATDFDPNDPGKHLTSKAWRALTEEQKTASREAHANQKRACGSVSRSVNMSWRRTQDSEEVAAVPAPILKSPPAPILKSPPVAAMPQAQDVEMADAGVAKITAGVSSLGYGGLKPASRKPVCVQINATQRIPNSHRVSYSVGTKGGSTKGLNAITEMEKKQTDASDENSI
jgi:hypothetical protein